MACHMKQAQGGFPKYAIKITGWHCLYKRYSNFRINLMEMVPLSLGQRKQEGSWLIRLFSGLRWYYQLKSEDNTAVRKGAEFSFGYMYSVWTAWWKWWILWHQMKTWKIRRHGFQSPLYSLQTSWLGSHLLCIWSFFWSPIKWVQWL